MGRAGHCDAYPWVGGGGDGGADPRKFLGRFVSCGDVAFMDEEEDVVETVRVVGAALVAVSRVRRRPRRRAFVMRRRIAIRFQQVAQPAGALLDLPRLYRGRQGFTGGRGGLRLRTGVSRQRAGRLPVLGPDFGRLRLRLKK